MLTKVKSTSKKAMSILLAFVMCITAFVLCNFTSLNILTIYFICQGLNIIKCIIGFILVKKGIWIKNIVDNNN